MAAGCPHRPPAPPPTQIASCTDCKLKEYDLWICLAKDCHYVGCSENHDNHSLLHYQKNPTHCAQMTSNTKRVWCFECSTQMDIPSYPLTSTINSHDSSVDINNQSIRTNVSVGGLKGAGEKQNTITNFGLDRGPSLNVSGAGDSQDSSDIENESVPDCSSNGKPRGLVGLQNIGNTCYMNSAIQALSNTPPLTQYFLDCNAVVDFLTHSKKPGLSRSYQKLVREIWNRNTRGYVVPNCILYGIRNVHPMFRGYHQHDTQEFLRCFMDQLHEELKEPIRANKPVQRKSPELGYITRQPVQQADSQNKELNCERGRLNRFKKSSTRSFDNIPLATANMYCRVHTQSENIENGQDFLLGHRRSASYCDPRGYTQLPQESKESSGVSPRPISPTNFMDYDSSGKECDDDDEETYETCDSGGSDSASLNGEETFLAQSNKGYKRKSDSENSDRHMSDNETTESSTPGAVQFRSVISDVFDGRLLSSVQCLTCDRISTRMETFQDLSLPIPSRDHMAVLHSGSSNTAIGLNNSSSGGGRNAACSDAVYSATSSQEGWFWWVLGWLRSWLYGPPVTLHDCLAAFFSADELKGDNMYSCEKCNKLRNGVKFSKVLGLPEVLCVHLKRFRHELSSSTKIGAKVSFPLTGLDMRPYLHKDCVSTISTYDLVAVICHAGTAGGGHYTCLAKNQQAGQWFEFDDQYVTGITPEQVSTSEAYVLFYKKTNPRMAGLRIRAMELVESMTELNDIKFFISKQWINRFNTYAEPGPIDNSDFLCPHGGVSPDRVDIVGRLTLEVSQPVYEFLYQNFGGGPACNHLHLCSVCLEEVERLYMRQKYEYEQFRVLHRNFTDRLDAASALFAISMNWFRIWQAFVWNKTQQPPPPIDNSGIIIETQDKTSMPTIKPGSDYTQISEEVWRFFYDIYGGGPEVILKSAPVVQASSSSSQNVAYADSSDYNSSHYTKSPDTVVTNYEQLSIKDSDNDENYTIDARYTKSLSNTDLLTTVNKIENRAAPVFVKGTSLQDVSMGIHNETVDHSSKYHKFVNKDLENKKMYSEDDTVDNSSIPNGYDSDAHGSQIKIKNPRDAVNNDIHGGKRKLRKASYNNSNANKSNSDFQNNTFHENFQKDHTDNVNASNNDNAKIANNLGHDSKSYDFYAVNDNSSPKPNKLKSISSLSDINHYFNKNGESSNPENDAVKAKIEPSAGVHQNNKGGKHKKSSSRKSKKQNGAHKKGNNSGGAGQTQGDVPHVVNGAERMAK